MTTTDNNIVRSMQYKSINTWRSSTIAKAIQDTKKQYSLTEIDNSLVQTCEGELDGELTASGGELLKTADELILEP